MMKEWPSVAKYPVSFIKVRRIEDSFSRLCFMFFIISPNTRKAFVDRVFYNFFIIGYTTATSTSLMHIMMIWSSACVNGRRRRLQFPHLQSELRLVTDRVYYTPNIDMYIHSWGGDLP